MFVHGFGNPIVLSPWLAVKAWLLYVRAFYGTFVLTVNNRRMFKNLFVLQLLVFWYITGCLACILTLYAAPSICIWWTGGITGQRRKSRGRADKNGKMRPAANWTTKASRGMSLLLPECSLCLLPRAAFRSPGPMWAPRWKKWTHSVSWLDVLTRRTSNIFGDRCFAAVGPRPWNSLPINLRQCRSLEQFKHLLKTFLFSARGQQRLVIFYLKCATHKITYLLTLTGD